jgi:polysaccharide biosynthesis protein PslG
VKLRLLLLVLAGASVLAGCGGGSLSGGASSSRPVIGLQDDRLALWSVDPVPRLRRIAGLGAKVVRVDLRWDQVASSRHPLQPANPDDPSYQWAHYDQVVTVARKYKLKVLFSIWGTPAWAADPSVPKSSRFAAYTARPRRASDFGDFAEAAARRYAPAGVHMWEVWNEPNVPLYLRPQFTKKGGRWVAASPTTYSNLLKAAYRGIKRADGTARVGGGVTAPAGDANPQSCSFQPDCRVTPLAFLSGLAQRANRPSMDVYSHHPYPITPPRSMTFAGASYIDLYNLSRLETALNRTYLRGKPLWLTEFGFATKQVPNYRLKVTPAQQAQYLSDAVRRVRADRRVRMFVWYFLQDNSEWASGLVRQNGAAKPAAQAFSRAAR